MKIGITGLNIEEGKTKYNDASLNKLVEKDKPKKVTPLYVEFVKDEYIQTDAIIIHQDSLLDLLILDMEIIESRLSRTADDTEKKLLEKCQAHLEAEQPLCDLKLTDQNRTTLQNITFNSLKPVLIIDTESDTNQIITKLLEKANYMFFYTSGPTESHAWLVKKNTPIIDCAAKIHTDLAKGFIKGDVVNFDDYLAHHNFNDCKSKGVAKLVERDYIVEPNDVIEIRFNV